MDQEWRRRGECSIQQLPTELFFPDQKIYEIPDRAAAACAVCPVRLRCLVSAVENDEQGIWGGTTERARRRWKKRAGPQWRSMLPAVQREDAVSA